jgi:hypothetical protein
MKLLLLNLPPIRTNTSNSVLQLWHRLPPKVSSPPPCTQLPTASWYSRNKPCTRNNTLLVFVHEWPSVRGQKTPLQQAAPAGDKFIKSTIRRFAFSFWTVMPRTPTQNGRLQTQGYVQLTVSRLEFQQLEDDSTTSRNTSLNGNL